MLRAEDESGRGCNITLVQHAFPDPSPDPDCIPGRLYFDGELVPLRSDLECQVLALLRSAEFRCAGRAPTPDGQPRISPNALILGDDIRRVLTRGPDENLRAQLVEVVRFVESDDYLRFADRVEQAADPTRYTVWPAWEPATRNQIAVRLGRLLGTGLRAGLEMLNRGNPLAEHASAIEVADLAERYSAEGVALRVEPAFRWRLTRPANTAGV